MKLTSVLLLWLAKLASAYYQCPTSNGMFPDPSSCTKFYHCANGIPYLKDCPATLHWNARAMICDWPQNANCGQFGQFLDQRQTTLRPQRRPATLDQSYRCPIQFGYVAKRDDCNQYYSCSQWSGIARNCPSGKHWNSNDQRCDWPEIALCDQRFRDDDSFLPLPSRPQELMIDPR
ncbi:Peritrophin-1 [Halotydeus destructor]|nr:Peritrophin-1 [Halotydeus destructor]